MHYSCCGCALHALKQRVSRVGGRAAKQGRPPSEALSCYHSILPYTPPPPPAPSRPASAGMNNAATDTFRTALCKMLGATLVCLPLSLRHSSSCCFIKASEKVPFVQCVSKLMHRKTVRNRHVQSVHVHREQ